MNFQSHRAELIRYVQDSSHSFEEKALRVFEFQFQYNEIYRLYLDILKIKIKSIDSIHRIPYLPISLFKTHRVKTGHFEPDKIFKSSGTTGTIQSQHGIRDSKFYLENAADCFKQAFTEPVSYFQHLALLPSYVSNPDSSLLFMLDDFIRQVGGMYLHGLSEAEIVRVLDAISRPTILWGVSYALYQFNRVLSHNPYLMIMETGGMKGKEREMTRFELHARIKATFNVQRVSSEYGMTELLSQAYAMENGLFTPNAMLKAFPRSVTDPLSLEDFGQTAALNLIDLANIDSCSFIATDDLGKVYPDDRFEVLGRMDHSDVRGCNQLI